MPLQAELKVVHGLIQLCDEHTGEVFLSLSPLQALGLCNFLQTKVTSELLVQIKLAVKYADATKNQLGAEVKTFPLKRE